MARLLFVVGILLADTVMMAPAEDSYRWSETPQACIAQLWACYFNTDRPAGAPDCESEFAACMQDAQAGG